MILPTHSSLCGLLSKRPEINQSGNKNVQQLLGTEWRDLKAQILNLNSPIETIKIRYEIYDIKDIIDYGLKGHLNYLRIIGLMLCLGYGVPKDYVMGRAILSKVISLGCDLAKYDMYTVLYANECYEEAVSYIVPLAQEHHLPSMVRLGVHYQYGKGVIKNQKKALEIWGYASKLGSVTAAKGMARVYYSQSKYYKKTTYFFLRIKLRLVDLFIYFKNADDDRIW